MLQLGICVFKQLCWRLVCLQLLYEHEMLDPESCKPRWHQRQSSAHLHLQLRMPALLLLVLQLFQQGFDGRCLERASAPHPALTLAL